MSNEELIRALIVACDGCICKNCVEAVRKVLERVYAPNLLKVGK